MYYPYYSSPAYYNVYVPARVRTVYVTRERSFGTTYRTQISARSKTATYRSSNGGTVKGSQVAGSKARFGSGSAGTSHGSGSLRSGSGSSGYKSGSGSSGYKSGSSRSGGSFGGGGLRSGKR
jgi:hypothetical protein